MAPHILVIGETLVDLVPGHNGREAILGGSPYNVAIGLGRLGAPVAIATSISTDKDGQRFKAALQADHVDLSFTAVVDAPSPTALVEEGTKESGPRYIFTLDDTAFMLPPPLPGADLTGITHVHIGSISALVGPSATSGLKALQAAKGRVTTSYDPNIRPLITPDVAATRQAVEARVAFADLVKASEEDIAWLYPERDPADAMRDWLKLGPKLCVLTRGGNGAEIFTADAHLAVPAPTITVADTVGAGDSLMSSLLFAMNRDGALGASHKAWTTESIAAWLAFAVKASAYTCTQKGSNPPRLRDL